MTQIALEPNPAAGRRLTPRFFDELLDHVGGQMAMVQRDYGLLPCESRQSSPVFLDPPDTVRLPWIHAVGSNGWLISSDPSAHDATIRPLDARRLNVGPHQIYACLLYEKIPTGNTMEQMTGEHDAPPQLARSYRRTQIVLEADEERFGHRDWLHVAQIERVREGGSVRTLLDPSFHPPITSMRAYGREPNPLIQLATEGLQRIEHLNGDSLIAMLRAELGMLRRIADNCTPEIAFLQSQRCIRLILECPEPPMLFNTGLENYDYSPDTFCAYLAHLSQSLTRNSDELYPDTLKIDEQPYHRLPGEFTLEGDWFSWSPAASKFFVNALAIYLPRAKPGTVPNVRYARTRSDLSACNVASAPSTLSAPGSALVLDRISNNIEKILVAVDSEQLSQRLRMQLGDGHAIYYY